MSKLVYLLLFGLMLTACDNQLVEPNYNETDDAEKYSIDENMLVGDQLSPRKSVKQFTFSSEYMFNSKSKDDNCGGFLGKCNLEYDYENEYERFIRNVRYYSPSKTVIDGKSYKTFSIYTINKREFIDKKGAVVGGKTWGTFSVHKVESNPIIYDEEGTIGNNFIAEHALKDLGPMIVKGKFSGDIKGSNIDIKLVGAGTDFLKGGKFQAREMMKCNSRFCWKSSISGKIKKVEFVDE